jgi:putative holliday junction resolvase
MSAGRLLGLDLGSRRIGVAVTDSDRTVATGVATLLRTGDPGRDHAAVAALVREYGAVAIVVGVPYSMGGGTGPAATAALAEVEALVCALDVEVHTVDERLTTVTAAGALRASGRRAKKARQVIDRAAAAVLLQAWIDREARLGAGT